jgi:polyhydroxybutyrate depolymerase
VLKRIIKAVKGNRPTISLPNWGKSRGYDIHLPPGEDPAKPLPLVVAIHGYTHDGLQMANLTSPTGSATHPDSLNSLANSEGFAVVYPYGTRIGFMPGRCWNAGGGINGFAPVGEPARRLKVNDVKFFRDLLDDVKQKQAIDDRRVYLVGISNGGAMAQRLAVDLPQLWAAVATVAGCNQYAAARNVIPTDPMPLLHIHGVEDRVWSYQGGDFRGFGLMESVESSVNRWVQANRATLEHDSVLSPISEVDSTRVRLKTYKGASDVHFYSIEGGGHAWPSGFQYLPKKLMGEVSFQLSANQVIWDFFRRHAKER